MSKHVVLTRKAAMTLGALHGFLKPRLAQDAKLDLTGILARVTSKNFTTQKPVILKGVTKALDGKLAKDASVEGLATLLDALEGEKAMDDPLPLETEPSAGLPMGEKDKSMDAGPDSGVHEQLLAFLKDKLSPEDMAQVEAMVHAEAADAEPDGGLGELDPKEGEDEDEPVEDEDKDHDGVKAKDEPPDFKGQPKPGGEMVTKDSMTQTIKAAVVAERRAATATREAERFVRPWVGDLAMAHDSAEGVLKTTLNALGVDIKGVHPSAYRAILERTPLPVAGRDNTMATDSAAAADFAKRFPEAARIKFC